MYYVRILALILLVSSAYARDVWNSYSHPFPIRDAVALNDALIIATDGGIRLRSSNLDYVYHSEDGLETSRFSAITNSQYGVFAVSEYGLVASLAPDLKRWNVVNRSFLNNKSRVIPGAVIIAEAVMVIAFEDRLAFVDLYTARSLLSITRIENKSLSVDKITRVHAQKDSLYVRLGDDVFVRKMNWSNMQADYQLSNPDSWKKVDSYDKIKELKTRESVWTVEAGDNEYYVGADSIGVKNGSTKGKVASLTFYNGYILGEVYEVEPVSAPEGGVMTAAVSGRLGYNNNTVSWLSEFYIMGSYTSAYDARMKVLATLPDGHVFFHSWGIGYFIFEKWNSLSHSFYSEDNHCFDSYLDGNKYSIASAAIAAPDNSGFLTASASKKGFSLLYFTKDGELHCAKNVGTHAVAGSMYARVSEDGDWEIFVGSRIDTHVAKEGTLEIFRVATPKANGNELNVKSKRSVGGLQPSPIDMAYDSRNDRLWLVSTTGLAYYDEESDTLFAPQSINGMSGAEYTSIATDVHSNLWVGSSNQGVYRLSPKGSSPDTLSVEHYMSKHGLLSDNVSDVAIDSVFGIAWFAQEKGLTSYRRNDLRSASKNMTDEAEVKVSAFPIPFRPKVHGIFTIEGIDEKATVSIHNRGGALVRSFKGYALSGGRLEWNGMDKEGRLVAPGVYYYVIKGKSTTKKGKFMIIH